MNGAIKAVFGFVLGTGHHVIPAALAIPGVVSGVAFDKGLAVHLLAAGFVLFLIVGFLRAETTRRNWTEGPVGSASLKNR